MSYRDHAEGVIDLTNPFFPLADPSKKIWSSVETQFMVEFSLKFLTHKNRELSLKLLSLRKASKLWKLNCSK